VLERFRESLNKSARARRRLCGRLRPGLGARFGHYLSAGSNKSEAPQRPVPKRFRRKKPHLAFGESRP